MLYSKIHRATVTDANLNYVGSITIDEELMHAVHILDAGCLHFLKLAVCILEAGCLHP